MNPGQEALLYLVHNLVMFGTIVVMARFILQLVKADFYNPVSQFVVKITNPMLIPLRKIIPGFAGIDWASVVLMITIQYLYILISTLIFGGQVSPIYFLALSIHQILLFATYFYFGTMIIQALMSWFVQGYNPFMAILWAINEPLLRPIRKIIPPIGGLDISMIFAFIGINLFQIFVLGYFGLFVQMLKGI